MADFAWYPGVWFMSSSGNERTPAMIATNIRPDKGWLWKTAKTTTCNFFFASKLHDYVEEGLLFQNIPKPKNHPCRPRSPIFSRSIKLGYATFCWFCDYRVTFVHFVEMSERNSSIERPVPRELPPNFNPAVHFQNEASSQISPTHGHTLWIIMCMTCMVVLWWYSI